MSEFRIWYEHGLREGRLISTPEVEQAIRGLRARLPISSREDQRIRLNAAIAGYTDVLIERGGQNV